MIDSYLDAFDQRFAPQGDADEPVLPICDFARIYLFINLTLFQRVILKLFAGEELSDEAEEGYDISETEWLELMHARNHFPPDVYERINERGDLGFENINLVVGRRGGKTTVIAVAVLYTIYKLLRYNNPQEHYGIVNSEDIIVAVAATSGTQANEAPFGKIKSILREAIANGSPFSQYMPHKDGIMSDTVFFQTEHDKEIAKNPLLAKNKNASVLIKSYHTNQATLRGGSIIVSVFDEFAWFPVTETIDKGAQFYQTLTASMHQFGADACAFTLSSPGYQFGRFFEIYNAAWSGGLRATVSANMSSWEAWEFEHSNRRVVTKKVLADDDRIPEFNWDYENGETFESAYEKSDPSFKREYGAEFEGSEEQWLLPILIDRMFDEELSYRTFGNSDRVYYAAADPGYVDDAFAFSIGHREDDTAIIDHTWRWYVAPDQRYREKEHETVYYRHSKEPVSVDLEEVMEHIKTCLRKFNIRKLTFDQKDSPYMVTDLNAYCRKKGIKTSVIVKTQNREYNINSSTIFRRKLHEHRLKTFPNEPLRQELFGLQKDKKGVVAKGPRSKDDEFDTIRSIVHELEEAPEFSGEARRGRKYNLTPAVAQTRM